MNDQPRVTVVIPTYNRYKYVLKAIESVLNQTYNNIEIIVVDDCSTQPEYITEFPIKIREYQATFKPKNIGCMRLKQNSKAIFGYPCTAYVRNVGIQLKTKESKWIAFLDDDDIWYPTKIEKQIQALQQHPECLISSTDGRAKDGKEVDLRYNREMCRSSVEKVFGINLDHDTVPIVWKLDDIVKHNLMVTSSVMVSTDLIVKVGGFQTIPNPCAEDYDCWKRCLQHTDLAYVDEECFVYDLGHGDGRNW
jgi:glycosyltransferase involved in cell wall biosynthesis